VRAKCPSPDEEPLDGPSIKKAAEEILKTDDFDSCSTEFKNELRYFCKCKKIIENCE
jgi:hypothetical protein